MRRERMIGSVEAEPAVALDDDYYDVDFAIGMGLDARSRIEMHEIDVQITVGFKRPVDSVAVAISAERLVEPKDRFG